MCKNGELLLEAIKLHFRKAKRQELADDLPSEPLALVELGVCSSKNYPCIRGQWKMPWKDYNLRFVWTARKVSSYHILLLGNRGKCGKKEPRSNWWRNSCNAGGLNDGNKNEMPHVQHIPPVL